MNKTIKAFLRGYVLFAVTSYQPAWVNTYFITYNAAQAHRMMHTAGVEFVGFNVWWWVWDWLATDTTAYYPWRPGWRGFYYRGTPRAWNASS